MSPEGGKAPDGTSHEVTEKSLIKDFVRFGLFAGFRESSKQ